MFDEIVGKTFARLYVKFPSPIYLPMTHFVGEGNSFTEDESSGLNFPIGEAEFAFDCVNWLIGAGFASGKPDSGSIAFGSLVLTAKGLEVLKLIPDSLSSSLGDRFASAVKQGSIDSVRKLTSQTLSAGISVAIGLIAAHLK